MDALSPWRFSVAPMMDWTDRHCRAFHRVLTRRALLYTEMVTANAVIHGDRERVIGWSPGHEGRVALQLGGNDPPSLAEAARIGEAAGYAEINLNCGCPSDRVQGGAFGACLMLTPALVADCVAAMKGAVSIPVTVKCRLGVDDQDQEEALDALTAALREAGVDALIVHARKAWLQGLSPKQNREIPPLDHARVHRLKQANPDLPVAVNGGLKTLEQWRGELAHVDGVMVGREAYHNPESLLAVDEALFGEPGPVRNMAEALEAYEPYVAAELARGARLHSITRHLTGLFPGRPGARAFRQALSRQCMAPGAGVEALRLAASHVASAAASTEGGAVAEKRPAPDRDAA
jgi:tRNA-dihydrouridine synthase A